MHVLVGFYVGDWKIDVRTYEYTDDECTCVSNKHVNMFRAYAVTSDSYMESNTSNDYIGGI